MAILISTKRPLPRPALFASSPMRNPQTAKHGCTHGLLNGWYIGPTLESYRCFMVWIWDTRRKRITDTLSWFPTKVTMPNASSTDLVIAGIYDIVHALTNPSNKNSAFAPQMESKVQALRDITTLLSNIAAPPKPAPPLRMEPEETTVLPIEEPPCPPLVFPRCPQPPTPMSLIRTKTAPVRADANAASKTAKATRRPPLLPN
jgi:hypothetical protein